MIGKFGNKGRDLQDFISSDEMHNPRLAKMYKSFDYYIARTYSDELKRFIAKSIKKFKCTLIIVCLFN